MAKEKKQDERSFAITCNKEGFWRAGRQWSREPIIVKESELTSEQWKLLREEPRITIKPAEPEQS